MEETRTAKDGSFQFTHTLEANQKIKVNSIGYITFSKVLTSDSSEKIEIALSGSTFELAPIEIIGQSLRAHKKLPGTMSKLEPDTVDLIKPVGTQELLEFIPGIIQTWRWI